MEGRETVPEQGALLSAKECFYCWFYEETRIAMLNGKCPRCYGEVFREAAHGQPQEQTRCAGPEEKQRQRKLVENRMMQADGFPDRCPICGGLWKDHTQGLFYQHANNCTAH